MCRGGGTNVDKLIEGSLVIRSKFRVAFTSAMSSFTGWLSPTLPVTLEKSPSRWRPLGLQMSRYAHTLELAVGFDMCRGHETEPDECPRLS